MNINGIGDGSKLQKLHQIVRDDEIDVSTTIETHQTVENIKILRRVFEDFDVYTRGRNLSKENSPKEEEEWLA